jgi:hypothetical protein
MSSCTVRLEPGAKSRYQTEVYKGKTVLSHRLAYAKSNGLNVFSMGGVVMHSCDNPLCVSPEHLSLGTHATNQTDKTTKGRQAYGAMHGMAVLSEDQVRYIKENYVKRHKEFGGRALAKAFGVHESTVSDIMLGHTRRLS